MTRGALLRLRQFIEEKAESLCGKLRSVKGGWRERAQSFGNSFGRNRTRCSESAACEALRQERGASDGSCTTAAQEARFGDAAIFDSRGKLQNVATDRIRRLHLRARGRQLAGVARIPEVVQDQFAEHYAIVAQVASHFSTATESQQLDCKIRQ